MICYLALSVALLAPAPAALAFTQPASANYRPNDIRQADATPTPANSAIPPANKSTPSASAPILPRVVAPSLNPSASSALSVTATVTTPVVSTNGVVASSTPTDALTTTTTAAATPPIAATVPITPPPPTSAPPSDPSALDARYAGALEGTIIANRTAANVRYFVEGQTYDLAALRSIGLQLPRPTAVLNLFNCDSSKTEADTGCFWDPYLLKQDGFYEVVAGADAGAAANLILREAGAPPADQIWVQNRTGQSESIIVNNQVVEIPPASVQEFNIAGEGPVIVHLRNCMTQGGQTACEWAPTGVNPGYYYGLIKSETLGANDILLTSVSLEGIVASSGDIVARPPQGSCVLRVPTLNVRGGPGLEFPIVAKIRGTPDQPASVVVVGFDGSKQWLQVSDRVAQNGWIMANPDFIICTGDLAALPVTTDLLAALPTPTPETVVAAPAVEAPPVAEAAPAEATVEVPAEAPVAEAAPVAETAPVESVPVEGAPTDAQTLPDETATEAAVDANAPAAIPAGLARIIVNNGFDQVMRFTLDQQYRVETNNLSGEWDLQPGESISVLVYPGMIPFSASTPWNGLADNADLVIEKDQERALWLFFVPDPDGSGNWNLQY